MRPSLAVPLVRVLRKLADAAVVAAATATIFGYVSISVQGDRATWPFTAVLGGLGLTPYPAALAINRAAAGSRTAAVASFCGSLLVSALGLTAIALIHHNAMMLIGVPDAMNCGGPILEIGAPLVQFAVLAPVALLCLGIRVARWARKPAAVADPPPWGDAGSR